MKNRTTFKRKTRNYDVWMDVGFSFQNENSVKSLGTSMCMVVDFGHLVHFVGLSLVLSPSSSFCCAHCRYIAHESATKRASCLNQPSIFIAKIQCDRATITLIPFKTIGRHKSIKMAVAAVILDFGERNNWHKMSLINRAKYEILQPATKNVSCDENKSPRNIYCKTYSLLVLCVHPQ